MKKIGVMTATRAEYGLLAPVVARLREAEGTEFRAELIVTGTHLSGQYGMTVREIEASGMRIDHRIPIPVGSGTELDISVNQAEALVKFTELFFRNRYDAVMILGDRYEMLAAAVAAGNTRTPVFHISGGDTTEGAADEWIRHSVTKISYLHFVTNEDSRRRVIQMGEAPGRVFNYGSTSIDNILTAADMPKEEALASVGLKGCRYAVCTYHPVTMEGGNVDGQVSELLGAIREFPAIQFIVTKSNADQGGARINEILESAGTSMANLHVYASLGVRRYLSLMKYCEFVLGNSSSGIIEAPAFHVPTVDIGDRQRGRLKPGSVINCAPDKKSVAAAMRKAMSEGHREICRGVESPYGDGHAAGRIAQKAMETVMEGKIDMKKKFYDMGWDV